ncbi:MULTISPECIES: DNA polymerase II [Tatumella]|uniref:DNA polymerase n=1 Tax=Tatumella punctata TaxID=399969 RepID=A0ABW1VQU6_9GAMM|nr:DNA polymerase II [Tatumella sp. JGM16]MBS0876862.1 DNA polymerase II [Tatumella sp. JGM82]MBS0889713.1 DNA polymerase II [Tatumella sp. JGM94]MBS0892791.1 DNA polymerase II [Tatumella sp. JGM130]MBS0902829.1 DNA polymerase II [Tatumella sp. JGM100]MBS0911865.1 DNA polymerase II [Tatumella sp. JGM91]
MNSPQPGFLLTRHWRDTPHGIELTFWLATDNGPVQLRVPPQQAVAFIPQSAAAQAANLLRGENNVRLTPLQLRDFSHQPLSGLYCHQYRQLQRLEKRFREHGIRVYEADIRPAERFLMERFINAPVWFSGQQQGAVITDARLKPHPDYRPALKWMSLDIETSAQGELYCIGIEGCGQQQVMMLGPATDGDPPTDFRLDYAASHQELLEMLNQWITRYDPDVIIGWNLVQFDLQILQKHAERYRIPLRFGRGNSLLEWRENGFKPGTFQAMAAGRLIIDGIEALRSTFRNFSSFSLENVARELLGESKLIGDPDNRMAEITHNFATDKPALARYNLRDCQLVTRIFEQTQLMPFLLERSSVNGLQADRHGGSVASFSHLYIPRMHRAGFVAPNTGEIAPSASPGGYVMDSRPGLYDSVLVLDYKSLYPSIIKTFLIDPIGLAEGLAHPAEESSVAGFLGARFSRTVHCLPEIIDQIWRNRDNAKQQANQPLSQALKIIMNAFYGVLGTPACRFFDPRLASSITLRGHEIMQQTRDFIERQGYEVIYGDTDSIFVWLKTAHSEQQAEETGRQLADNVNHWWRKQLADRFMLTSALELEYENHYCRFLMPTIRGAEQGSKKRYAGRVNNHGKDQIIFKGLENVRTDWTPLAREFQQKLYDLIFRRQAWQQYVRDTVEQLMAGELDEQLIYTKRLRRPLSEYQKNIPPHARAAMLADQQHRLAGQTLRYQQGGTIRYVMTTRGPQPLNALTAPPDYDHYLSRQLEPVADGILGFVGGNFATLITGQLGLF